MLFNSYLFIIFFALVCIAYYLLPRGLKNPLLLICSYIFYGMWNWAYLTLIIATTFTTYVCALRLAALSASGAPNARGRMKLVLAATLALNLGVLFVFKYFNLFSSALGLIGISVPTIAVLLPVGISFYTFQTLGYAIDVYRGEIPAERNFLIYALFISFFPQLVAGPIESAKTLLPQFKEEHRFSYEGMRMGLLLMLWGFFMKLVVADRAAQVVEHIYKAESVGGFRYLVATTLFSFQIYGDFAGYSMIAIGAAQVLGFRLMRNFRQPYLSRSVGEFWRRWHISLNNWFRDYVYYPLGGSRRGRARTLINLMIVFLLSGLWHGAAYTFVLWGLINGVYQIVERALPRLKPEGGGRLGAVVRICLTFMLVTLAWVPFRAQSLTQAFSIFAGIFSPSIIPSAGELTGQTQAMYGIGKLEIIALALGILTIIAVDIAEARKAGLAGRIEQAPVYVRWLVYYALLFATLIFGVYGSASGASAFLYFQF